MKGTVRRSGVATEMTFRYGDQFPAGTVDVERKDIAYVRLPARVQYASRKTGVFEAQMSPKPKAWLRENQRVEIIEYDPKVSDTHAKIDQPRGYVDIKDLQDHPVSAEERRAVAEKIAEQKRKDAEDRQAKVLARKGYAQILRNRYLDEGLDIKVSVSGKSADHITLQYVLFNDVWSHKMQQGSLISEIRDLGFRRLDMKDGYDWHVYWNFNE